MLLLTLKVLKIVLVLNGCDLFWNSYVLLQLFVNQSILFDILIGEYIYIDIDITCVEEIKEEFHNNTVKIREKNDAIYNGILSFCIFTILLCICSK